MRHLKPALAAMFLLFLVPLTASAATPLVELRVEGPTQTLDSGTWYVTGTERIRKSKPADDCERTDGRIRIPGPTALGLVETGAAFNSDLNQVRIRRDEAGIFVCEIGSILGRSFSDPAGFAGWSYYSEYVFGSEAADLVDVGNGDKILWVFSDFGVSPANTGSVLELKRVPARDADGEFEVRVVEHSFDGSANPAPGATIEGAGSVNELDNGLYRVTVDSGFTELRATRGLDVDSNHVETCFKQRISRCPRAHGRTIVGSDRADDLPGTRGFDTIKAGGGGDTIDLRKGGRDKVRCGSGNDLVLLDRGDRDDNIAANCERKRRS